MKTDIYTEPVKVQEPVSGQTFDLPSQREHNLTRDPTLSDEDKIAVFYIEYGLISKALFGDNKSRKQALKVIEGYSFCILLTHWKFLFEQYIKNNPFYNFDQSREFKSDSRLNMIGGADFIKLLYTKYKEFSGLSPLDLVQSIQTIKEQARKRTDDKKQKSEHLQATENPEFIPMDREIIYKIIVRGVWQTLVGETGTGKTTFVCHIIAQELKKSPDKKAYIYSQESDFSDNIVPAFLAEGMSLEQINNQIIFKGCLDYDKEKKQVFFDIKLLSPGSFVVIEPTPIIVKNPNNSKQVPLAIQEYQNLAREKGLFLFGLHHTTTGWSASTLKEQGKFAKEWISYPRHCLILKEKEDGSLIMFISKSNLMRRIGAIEFSISQTDIELSDFKKTLKNRPFIKSITCHPDLSTKKILKTMFKHEAGLEKPKRMKQSTEELRGTIVQYIKDNGSGLPPKDFVLRQPLKDHCLKNNRVTKWQFDRAIKELRKDGVISIDSGQNNRSQYRLVSP